jgi:hypothetical protein
VDKLLGIAAHWLDTARPPIDQPELDSDSKRHWLKAAGLRDDDEQVSETLSDWLATLEELVLLDNSATDAQRSHADELITKAHRLGFCVTRSVAARAYLKKLDSFEAAAEISRRLADRNDANVGQACDAVIR